MRPEIPPGIGDISRPSPARVYDALLGGLDNWQADRDLAVSMVEAYPGVRSMAVANRMYVAFAVTQAQKQGIRQFIDLGSGFPFSGSVLDVAKAHDPAASVACVDIEEDVAGYGPLLDHLAGFAMVRADIRDPDAVLDDTGLREVIDLAEPCCLVFGLVAHTMPLDEARRVVAGYTGRAAEGSAVVITVARGCGDPAFMRAREAWQAGTGSRAGDFSVGDIAGLLAGLDVQGGIGPVGGIRKAGYCAEPHIAGAIAFKRRPAGSG